MNELKVFNNGEFGEVRTVVKNNEPYFVGKDVADILGYSNSRKALIDHVDEEDKDDVTIRDAIGRNQTMIAINESGLYSLILSSKLPNAKKFKRWVTSEVLPSIRQNGGYIANQESLSEDEILANAIMVAKNVIEKQKLQLQEQAPKVIFADAVSASKTSILVGELAKLLKQNGINMGQNRLFDWLRTNGFLIRRKGTDYNMPTQTSMEMGLFEIKETSITHSDGHISVSKTPKVTGKGQVYFINKFLQSEDTALTGN